MRHILTGLLLTSCLLPLAAGAMKISDSLMETTAPHAFSNLDASPLWTSEVRRIDTARQAYERLPSVLAADTMVAEAKPNGRGKNLSEEDAPNLNTSPEHLAELNTTADAGKVSAAAMDWCAARYRSYDKGDNSYQPFGGGPRRVCAPPAEIATPALQQVAEVGDSREIDARAKWCMDRYNSYRLEDNSYQPFSGPRKRCVGPESQSASITSRNTAEAVAQF